MINFVFLQGRLGQDPQTTTTNNGKHVTKVSIAVDGRDDSTMWVNLVAFEKTGEFLQKYWKKGDLITVQGRLDISSYVDKNSGKKGNILM